MVFGDLYKPPQLWCILSCSLTASGCTNKKSLLSGWTVQSSWVDFFAVLDKAPASTTSLSSGGLYILYKLFFQKEKMGKMGNPPSPPARRGFFLQNFVKYVQSIRT
jgi:hypothetical protein